MDKQYSRTSKFYFEQYQYRSTSDLIPKCRSQALKAKREAARIKINLIAKQLYELKYDHEWEQQQLRRLVNKGDCIMKQVDEKIKKVQEEVIQLNSAVEETMEELNMQKIKLKEESFLVSERSTQPEVQNDTIPHKKTSHMLMSQRFSSKKEAFEKNRMLKSAVLPTKNMLNSSQHLKLATTKRNESKQTSIKSSIKEIPFLNVIIFITLLLVVLVLL